MEVSSKGLTVVGGTVEVSARGLSAVGGTVEVSSRDQTAVEDTVEVSSRRLTAVGDSTAHALIQVAGGAHLRAQRVGACGEGCGDESAAKDGGQEEFFHGLWENKKGLFSLDEEESMTAFDCHLNRTELLLEELTGALHHASGGFGDELVFG